MRRLGGRHARAALPSGSRSVGLGSSAHGLWEERTAAESAPLIQVSHPQRLPSESIRKRIDRFVLGHPDWTACCEDRRVRWASCKRGVRDRRPRPPAFIGHPVPLEGIGGPTNECPRPSAPRPSRYSLVLHHVMVGSRRRRVASDRVCPCRRSRAVGQMRARSGSTRVCAGGEGDCATFATEKSWVQVPSPPLAEPQVIRRVPRGE
jgi:hypothetical protein